MKEEKDDEDDGGCGGSGVDVILPGFVVCKADGNFDAQKYANRTHKLNSTPHTHVYLLNSLGNKLDRTSAKRSSAQINR